MCINQQYCKALRILLLWLQLITLAIKHFLKEMCQSLLAENTLQLPKRCTTVQQYFLKAVIYTATQSLNAA